MANPKLNLSNKSGSLPVHFEFKPQIMDSYCIVPFRSTRIIEIRTFAPPLPVSLPSRQEQSRSQVVRGEQVGRGFVGGCGRGKWLIDGEFSIVFPKNYSIRVIVESSCWSRVIISHERIIMRTAR